MEKAWAHLFPDLPHSGYVALGRLLDLSELQFPHWNMETRTSMPAFPRLFRGSTKIYALHFPHVDAEPNSIINETAPNLGTLESHITRPSLLGITTPHLSRVPGYKVTTYGNNNFFLSPQMKSQGMGRGGRWRIRCCNEGLSYQLPRRTSISHYKGWMNW